MTQYIRPFPPSPKSTFELLAKLDRCFASLLVGEDIYTHDPLPGFENGLRAGMTTTDMVRCRSLVEQTRVLVVEVMSNCTGNEEEEEEEDDDDTVMGTDAETETDAESGYASNSTRWGIDDDDDDELGLDAAKIYEQTIIRLNERLGDPLGLRTMSDN